MITQTLWLTQMQTEREIEMIENLITWKSKKQKVVALSSVEAEFRGIAKGRTEIIWMQKLLSEQYFPFANSFMIIKQQSIGISGNLVQHDCTKHVEIEDIS
jgi:hypothetical protein